ncbi:MAG: tRNA (uridine(54)-C5)-methyltransferase TrmA [Pseudomonadota bacterium]
MPFYFDPDNYNALLSEKIDNFKGLLTEFDTPELLVYASPNKHFRMRAEFKMWHDRESKHTSPYPVMFRKDADKTPVRITNFPIASEAINHVIKALPELLQDTEVLKQRLFQMECLSAQNGDTLLTLIYHKPLDEQWTHAAEQLAKTLNVSIIGRSRKQKVVIGQDHVFDSFTLSNGSILTYKQLENTFTQPNAAMNTAMLNWVSQHTHGLSGDALELYCGNGNFTVALAKQFKHVFATEVVKTAVKTARENFELNKINNATVIRMSSEEFTQAMNCVRPFRRLKDVDLSAYDFSTILVDPPRSGLDEQTCAMAQAYQHIVYISCNPDTLCDNLRTLTQTHDIIALAAFDQFPYTQHLESGVLLKKRD